MTIIKVALLFLYSKVKKMRMIQSIFDIEQWLWKLEFCCFRPSILKRLNAKNIFMAVFIVLWPYLLTSKLRYLQKINIGHTRHTVSFRKLELKFIIQTKNHSFKSHKYPIAWIRTLHLRSFFTKGTYINDVPF